VPVMVVLAGLRLSAHILQTVVTGAAEATMVPMPMAMAMEAPAV
jgi:hypothetical protein